MCTVRDPWRHEQLSCGGAEQQQFVVAVAVKVHDDVLVARESHPDPAGRERGRGIWTRRWAKARPLHWAGVPSCPGPGPDEQRSGAEHPSDSKPSAP
jgi:hypothetical protein